ncbi:MAG: hypothetical protein A3G25_18235 [Betaproteobacteria bacterium RIFCSPLOWO2_12_FULL_63_13]|nr:MAG: hypothetical protein A3H32_17205 [Betaproteobacteria bacterium RIFCSPLOWO2_02_FULL_63_19]OGA50047.1 MAG: hypothetical protein A3G25_18235 [Betaproteobacteria bacterium RIFCSPLOWO2_12_FULL_63_13]
MKLHLTEATGKNAVTGYGDGYVLVNQERHERTLVVLPDRLVTDWPASSFEALTAAHVAALLPLGAEIILLGTGKQLRFPRAEIMAPLIRARVGYEIMDVQAACRTFNVLVSEERKVAAALLLG